MLSYPSLEAVNQADRIQLGRWVRFLPSPGLSALKSPDFGTVWRQEGDILERIINRFTELGGWSPEISKEVGLTV